MDWTLFPIFLAATAAAGATGVMFRPGDWYAGLRKPGFTPPNIVFPIAWTTIYLCIAIAAARVAYLPGSGLALALWGLQIALNTLWTPVFFGLHRMRAGLVIIGLLWLTVLAATLAFWRLDTLAGVLFLPYLAWGGLAAALNAAVIRLNPQAAGRSEAVT